ncbi:MAG: transposase family protein [Phormidium sp.]
MTSQPSLEAWPERIEILEAFADLPDVRKASGKRHHIALCLALFTLAVTAGNRGFLSIGDWLKCYQQDLINLFDAAQRPPSLLQHDSAGVAEAGLWPVFSRFSPILWH